MEEWKWDAKLTQSILFISAGFCRKPGRLGSSPGHCKQAYFKSFLKEFGVILLSLHSSGERDIRTRLIPTEKVELEWVDYILKLYKQFCPDFDVVVLHLKV